MQKIMSKKYGLPDYMIAELESHGLYIPSEQEAEDFDRMVCRKIIRWVGCDFDTSVKLYEFYTIEYARKELQ